MALVKCPDCHRDVSNLAVSCPHCGRPLAPQAGGTDNGANTTIRRFVQYFIDVRWNSKKGPRAEAKLAREDYHAWVGGDYDAMFDKCPILSNQEREILWKNTELCFTEWLIAVGNKMKGTPEQFDRDDYPGILTYFNSSDNRTRFVEEMKK